jgi:hypothetical protein
MKSILSVISAGPLILVDMVDTPSSRKIGPHYTKLMGYHGLKQKDISGLEYLSEKTPILTTGIRLSKWIVYSRLLRLVTLNVWHPFGSIVLP